MPTYVYECKKCNQTFELEQRMSEDALTTCQCGQNGDVKRVIQAAGIAFKGSGFYVTDSGSKTTAVPQAQPAEACGPSCACHPSTDN